MNDARQKVLELMAKSELCVISSVGPDGGPQSAVVGFSENKELQLMIATSNESRKYRNMLADERVSVVIGWDDRITIQYEGLARQLTGDDLVSRQAVHFAKQPRAERFKDLPTEVYFSIEPTYIRYTDTTVSPWLAEEIKDFA